MKQYLSVWYIIIATAASWFGCNEKAKKVIEVQVENNPVNPLMVSPVDSSKSYGMDAQGMIFLYPSVI